jgi:hypothetical protein
MLENNGWELARLGKSQLADDRHRFAALVPGQKLPVSESERFNGTPSNPSGSDRPPPAEPMPN